MSWETLKIIFYVVIGIVYFLFQLQKNKKNQTKPTPSEASSPKSLEEMLKEFGMQMEEKQKEEPVIQPVVTQKKVNNRSEEGNIVVENTQKSIRQIQIDKAEVKKTAAIDYEQQGVSYTYEERKPFKEYSNVAKPNYYAQLIANPKTIKDAIVIAEIMNRKF